MEDNIGKENDNKFESPLRALEKLVDRLAAGKKNTPQRNPNVTCWKCNKKGHVQRECQVNYSHAGKPTCSHQVGRRMPFLKKAPEEGRNM
ncbi:hypothetical protein AVEN_64030-1 [Araneus ventricosus]|uniref:CCHC-type domain-containing protein n=1 Tax=Araneus ventricosus TaxID=182803 RepID=A0A4Y2LX04_ARAVE|nr:hypothetical protein AVEN_64030-1 [Araneus ventricosus]